MSSFYENKNHFVSIIIPCRNEEKFISDCLDSILKNDYPREKMEIFIVDGMSEDRTKMIVNEYIKKYSFIKFLENPKKITGAAMNIGILQAKGDVIVKMDAHSEYARDYISKCVKYLYECGADNVGGSLITVSRENTFIGNAIAFVLSHPFGAGNSYFRIGSNKPRWVDTVSFGCFKREVFKKIGFYDEKAGRIEDMELNLRLKKAGGRILLSPDVIAYYYPKSDLGDFFKHNFDDGIWAIYPMKFVKVRLKIRHYIPFVFVGSLAVLGGLSFFSPFFLNLLLVETAVYLLCSFYFSAKIALREKKWQYFFVMPAVFAVRHIGYGLGSVWGLIKLFA